MAKKSFKKGVDSLIQPTGNNEKKEKPKKGTKTTSPNPKTKNSGKEEEKITLDLGARLTIDNLPVFKQKIEDALSRSKSVILKSDYVEDIDLPFIQMVMATERSCEIEKKKLILELNIPDDVAQLLINSGFNNFFK